MVRLGVRHYQLHRFARLAVAGYPHPAARSGRPPQAVRRQRRDRRGRDARHPRSCWGWRFQKLPFGPCCTPTAVPVRVGAVPRSRPRRADSTQPRLRRRMGELELQGLRGQAVLRRVPRRRPDDGRTRRRPGARLRSCPVGELRGQQQLRHDDGPDAAAVLDRRMHRLQRRPVLRGVRHHAVPLPRRRSDVEEELEPGARTALHRQRCVGRCAPTSRTWGSSTTWRSPRRRRPGRAEQPELTAIALAIRAVAHLPGGGQRHRHPAHVQPVVVNERSGDQRERWLEVGTSWMQNTDEWAAMPASVGPATGNASTSRPTSHVATAPNAGDPGRQVDVVEPTTPIDPVAFPEARSAISTSVSNRSVPRRRGRRPVLVRVSYFPNWKVSGRRRPYRVARRT